MNFTFTAIQLMIFLYPSTALNLLLFRAANRTLFSRSDSRKSSKFSCANLENDEMNLNRRIPANRTMFVDSANSRFEIPFHLPFSLPSSLITSHSIDLRFYLNFFPNNLLSSSLFKTVNIIKAISN
jgi:hypothetical protein